MRFLLDESIHPKVAELAWELELDTVSVHDVRRRGLPDRAQLEFAAEQERVLITRNRGDYLYLTREFYRGGLAHCGVLLVEDGLPNDQPEMLVRSLRRWAQAHSYAGADDVGFGSYHVDFLRR
jgi:predicted nuclease of predicted toxin-antitoxin system